MSNVIKFSALEEMSKKAKNEEVKEFLSSPMKSLYKQIIFQALREAGDNMLGVTAQVFDEVEYAFNDEDKAEINEFFIEEMKDVIDGLEYIQGELK